MLRGGFDLEQYGHYHRALRENLMRCPTCGTDNSAANRYCGICGARLVASCPKCGHENAPSALFCSYCGGSLAAIRKDDHAERPGLRSIGQERKQVTVLFADIVGSTQLVAGIDPEEAMERLRPALKAMCEPVEHFD